MPSVFYGSVRTIINQNNAVKQEIFAENKPPEYERPLYSLASSDTDPFQVSLMLSNSLICL